jgi:hypothetical protein
LVFPALSANVTSTFAFAGLDEAGHPQPQRRPATGQPTEPAARQDVLPGPRSSALSSYLPQVYGDVTLFPGG